MSMTITEAAEQTGLTAYSLRYYERDGLLPRTVERTASGRRVYSDADIAGIVLVTRLRATGMPVKEVRRYATLVRAGAGNESERLEILRAHRRHVARQLAEVSAHLEAIDAKIGRYEYDVHASGTRP